MAKGKSVANPLKRKRLMVKTKQAPVQLLRPKNIPLHDDVSSDESVYSGLEEEPDTSEAEQNDSEEEHESEEEIADDVDNDSNSTDNEDGNMDDRDTEVNDTFVSNIQKQDEYEFDSSDEEDIRNTVGNIPMEWYREYKHIGYDTMGRKLIKPQQGDLIDNFLKKMDDPDYWRTVTNKLTGQEIKLTDEDLRIVDNIRSGRTPSGSEDPYAPWIEFFTNEVMQHPLTNRPEDKRSFVPSKWERLKVGQMVHAMKMGWMKPRAEKVEEHENERPFYMLWKDDDKSEAAKRYRQTIPAPKTPLPGHEESYNPPPEYLFNEKEKKTWMEKEPEKRRMNFMPEKYDSLRKVPGYRDYLKERLERCLDLYLCPRQRRMKLQVDPEDLIPKLPKPRDLQPFPTVQSIIYKGHRNMVRCLTIDPSGQWLASGSDDKTIKFWEVSTGRCVKTIKTDGKVLSIAWNPNPTINLVAFAAGNKIHVVNPGLVDKMVVTATDELLAAFIPPDEESSTPATKVPVTWEESPPESMEMGYRFTLLFPMEMKQVSWHGKGDYFVTLMPKGDSRSVIIHQLTRRRSQNPFKKPKGLIQSVIFHPVKPLIFVASQRYIRVYNLIKQQLIKKYQANCKWVSSLAIHPAGDNFIIGSYDCRLSWFDMDLSPRPYQNLRHHAQAVRQVDYHKRYPLFASVSDDGTAIVFHGMVYNDLMKNALIVPVKVLRGHRKQNQLTVLDCLFHPVQPWLFTSGSDSTIRLYT